MAMDCSSSVSQVSLSSFRPVPALPSSTISTKSHPKSLATSVHHSSSPPACSLDLPIPSPIHGHLCRILRGPTIAHATGVFCPDYLQPLALRTHYATVLQEFPRDANHAGRRIFSCGTGSWRAGFHSITPPGTQDFVI